MDIRAVSSPIPVYIVTFTNQQNRQLSKFKVENFRAGLGQTVLRGKVFLRLRDFSNIF